MNKSALFPILVCVLTVSACNKNDKKNNPDEAEGNNGGFVLTAIDITNTEQPQFSSITTYTNNLAEGTISVSMPIGTEGNTINDEFSLNDKGLPVSLARSTKSGDETSPLYTEVYSYNDQDLLIEARQARDGGTTSIATYAWTDSGNLDLEIEELRDERGDSLNIRQIDYQYDGEDRLAFAVESFAHEEEMLSRLREDYIYGSVENSYEILYYLLPSLTPQGRGVFFKDENGLLTRVENYSSAGALESTVLLSYESSSQPGINLLEFPRQCDLNFADGC